MTQLDLVCNSCPLADCDDESLWCMYRFLTSPNVRQRAAVKASQVVSIIREKPDRRKYYREYYRDNREQKITAALTRYHSKRETELATIDSASGDT